MIKWLARKGFFHLLSANFLTQFLGFGCQLLVAKFLTPIELGEIKILQSYTMIFAVVAGFGYNSAILKVCSENREPSEKNAFLRSASIKSIFTTIITSLILIVLSLSGVITSSRHLAIWLVIYTLVLPFTVFTGLFSVALQAAKRIQEMAKAQVFIRIQSFILIVLSTWLWKFEGFVFSTILAYAMGLIPLIVQVGTNFIKSKPIKMPKEFTQIAIFSVLANGTAIIGQYTDIFILDHFSSNRAQIGFYSLATIFYLGATQITATVQSIVTPYFSQNEHNETWIRTQLKKNQLRLVYLSIIVAFGVWAVAGILVPAIYGSEYQSVMNYLPILMIKYVIWSSYAIAGAVIFGLGMMKFNFISAAISTFFGFVISYAFIRKFGILGVAWGQCLSALISLALTYIFTRKVLILVFPKHTKIS